MSVSPTGTENRLFKHKGLKCIGYADDGCLITKGRHLKLMYRYMNEALELCRKWAMSYGLDISPRKTNYMLFTNKLAKSYSKEIQPLGLCINGKRIERVTQCKYLRLLIDNKLRWDAHINDKPRADVCFFA